jgi:hypothetical protein
MALNKIGSICEITYVGNILKIDCQIYYNLEVNSDPICNHLSPIPRHIQKTFHNTSIHYHTPSTLSTLHLASLISQNSTTSIWLFRAHSRPRLIDLKGFSIWSVKRSAEITILC